MQNLFYFLVDIPDPYVEIEILEVPDARKRTKRIKNNPNPKWFENFSYYIHSNPSKPTYCKVITKNKNSYLK